MAVRYSGDVEVRCAWNPRERRYDYVVRGRDGRRHEGAFEPRPVPRDPRSSESYDAVAVLILAEHRVHTVERDAVGRPRVRRMFRSPCPL